MWYVLCDVSVVAGKEWPLQCSVNWLLDILALFACSPLFLCYSWIDWTQHQPGWQTWACCVQFTDNTFRVFVKIFRSGFFFLNSPSGLWWDVAISGMNQVCRAVVCQTKQLFYIISICFGCTSVASCWQSWLFQENRREASQCSEMRWQWGISIWKLLIWSLLHFAHCNANVWTVSTPTL